ncbi:MAG: DUF5681 domain-containing protein [Syntrophobacteraceae bacterium]|nr:DUF5681 domain-containing protein [Syntrophobacteraceae bacterium]
MANTCEPKAKRSSGWGRPFCKGQSGNPKGRPKGSRNKSTLIAQALLEGEAQLLTRKVVDKALEGDRTCLQICMDRLIPKKKDSPIKFNLPQIGASSDIPKFLAAIAARFEDGEITPVDARALADLANAYRKLIEMAELEPRVSELEEMIEQQK